MANPSPYKRGRTYASLASLTNQVSLSAASAAFNAESMGQIVINFPCMPESLELARQATYSSIQTMVTPDGFHIYSHTDPLRIPLKFSLASVDTDYVGGDGAYALIAIAARLHALVMPVANASAPTSQASSLTVANGSEAGQVSANNSVQAGNSVFTTQADNLGNLYFPPACLLAIMMATGMPNGRPNMGINCTGFVERISVNLRGPWLQGTFDEFGPQRNLPSFADYEFTFVHQPGYTNNLASLATASNAAKNSGVTSSPIQTTQSQDIFSRFYLENRTGSSQTMYADIYGNVTPPGGNSPEGD